MADFKTPCGSSERHCESATKSEGCPHISPTTQSLTSQNIDQRTTSFAHVGPKMPPEMSALGCMHHQHPPNHVFPLKIASGSPQQLYSHRAYQPSCHKHEIMAFPCSLPTPTSPQFNVAHHHEAQKPHPTASSADVPFTNYRNRGPQDEEARFEHKRPESSATNAVYNPLPPANPQQYISDRWHQAQQYRVQVHEPPQIDPAVDSTLHSVSQNAEYWVTQLTHALTNTQSVKDTPSSHALRMFLPNCYDPLLIEATARQIFTFLLDRCTHGFRGPASFNKALKPVRDLEADRFGTCEERLRNVIEVLRLNKRVCKDVLYEDWKIRLLVNHPLGYDKDKDCQKGSNDQRRKRLKEEREKLEGAQKELEAMKMSVGAGKRKRVDEEVEDSE